MHPGLRELDVRVRRLDLAGLRRLEVARDAVEPGWRDLTRFTLDSADGKRELVRWADKLGGRLSW